MNVMMQRVHKRFLGREFWVKNSRRLAKFMNRKNFICRKFAERHELQLEDAKNLRRSANSRWQNLLVYTGLKRIVH